MRTVHFLLGVALVLWLVAIPTLVLLALRG